MNEKKPAYERLIPEIAVTDFPGTRLSTIRSLIDRADATYFNGGTRAVVMADEVYDKLKEELQRRCPDDPRLTRVGAPIPAESALEKVRHSHPMGSQAKVKSIAEVRVWFTNLLQRYEHLRLHVSHKLDGGSMSTTYIGGQLVRAITRGDGQTGQDITANAIRMNGVPSNIELNGQPFTGYVRSEVMLLNEDWKALDPDAESNPRNLGNGIAQRKNGLDCERLTAFAFRLYDANGLEIGATETSMCEIMRSMGLIVVPFFHAPDTADQVEHVEQIYNLLLDGRTPSGRVVPALMRSALPHEIDGLVLKIDQIALQKDFGVVGNCPAGQVALKFPPAGAPTILRDVEIELGRTGALIPVGIFDPVQIGGVSVSRATLCNFNEIVRLNIAIGDTILVQRRNDVIPKIIAKIADGPDRKVIEVPKKCPITGGAVGRITTTTGTESAHIYSLDAADCAPVKIAYLAKWVSELDIQGLGDVYLSALYDARYPDGSRLVEDPAGLYKLREQGVRYVKDAKSGRMIIGELSMTSILHEIDKKRDIELTKLLAAIGIHNLGGNRAQKIREKMPGEFDTLNDWFSGKLIVHAKELGIPKMAEGFHKQLLKSKPLIEKLFAAGVKVIESRTESNSGKLVFVLTGDFEKPKDYYHEIIARHGHIHAPRFTKKTTHVVTSNPHAQTVKAQEARKAGIPVISPDQMLVILTEHRVRDED